VRRMVAAYRSADPDEALAYFHPDVAYDTTLRPDGRVWRGRDGVVRAMFEWTDTWDEYELEVERCVEAPDDRVLMLWRERGRAKGSGVIVSEDGANVFSLREGMIDSVVVYLDRGAALQAAGLNAA
jgi:ketosteroid isomerase-like protein